MHELKILLDFDATCVTHEYPRVGKNIGAEPVLKELVAKGHKLILFTMRSGKTLDDAVEWFKKHEIPLYGIQTNPSQASWTTSPKAHGDLIIDDTGLFMPMKRVHNHWVCDWDKIREELVKQQIL